jgi:hypothetical protein
MKVAETRNCPIHHTGMYYWQKGDDYACQDVNCIYGHGMKVAERIDGLVLVKNADEMYDDDFVKHFELRHQDLLPGIDCILLPHDEETINLYREYHHKVHEYPVLFPFAERNHEHGE